MKKELLAPNGKPSGLYFTEIYNLVRTKEFKQWFGDWEEAYKTKDYYGVSKIIDENGEPLICVHNSPNEFFEFDEYRIGSTTDGGFYGKGFYFTPNVGQDRYGEFEYNCFLNIKNPYFKESSYRNYELKSDDLKDEGYDGVVVYPNWEKDFNFEQGVDRAEEIVAYYSEQIKLGDGTNTTFDSDNNDIRFEYGGEINLQIDERDKKLRNDKDYFPFEILNEKGEKLGKIDLMYRSDLNGYQISNSNVFEKGKGIGKKAYLKLKQILGKPIISDSSRTEDAENLWKSLERSNHAKYDSNIGKYIIYKKGGITESSTPDYLKFLIG